MPNEWLAGWGALVAVLGLLLCFVGGRALRAAAFCAGLGVGSSLAGLLGAGLPVRLLTGALSGLCALLLTALVVGTALFVVGALAGGAVALAVLRTVRPEAWGWGVTVAVVALVALVCAIGVLRFRRPLVQVLTALGGASLVLLGVTLLGPAGIAFLNDPGTAAESIAATAALLALAVGGWLVQRRRAGTRL
ncbi:hypothetical protein GCM10009836_72830 [Pseudonocardia ailaonensis]|uniref:DUF4203 domain-containing protein n=1 Tax=Pseudonocardia ailaonensis TaxID=367279 RepID=A0ABN2NQ55_9PSEU